jgi:cyclopropane fatty-acyl-phospholipid synthase-like methyltransferase
MHERDQKRLRATFDEAAQLYDRARPGYPPELCEDFVQVAGIGTGSRVLEIGAGTGQVTVPLAERGCQIVAVELGANMAALLRHKVARFPSVTVVVSAFEDWPLPGEPFDAVISATAFHWIDPKVRVTKVVDALRPDGALALISTHHILGGDKDFFVEVQTCYEHYDPTTSPGLRLPTAEQIPAGTEEFESSGQFGPMFTRRYERTLTYSTAEYLDLLLTYSGHRALAPEACAHLFACIAHLIDSRYSSRVRKRYLFELQVAHLRSDR